MSLYFIAFAVSLGCSVVGMVGYLSEFWLGRVDRFSKWRALSPLQWLYFVLAVQPSVVVPFIMLILWINE